MPTKTVLDSLCRDARVALDVVGDVVGFMRRIEADTIEGLLTKDDSSPVSAVDFAIQAFVASRLAHEDGNTPLVAEEDSARLRGDPALAGKVVAVAGLLMPGIGSGRLLEWIDRGGGTTGSRFWVLDPIDGTKGLLQGRQYATAMALVEDGRVQVGVIGCPRLSLEGMPRGGVAFAVCDKGAWWTSDPHAGLVPLRVSSAGDLSQAQVIRSWEDAHGDVKRLERILGACRNQQPVLRMDSQAKHAALAGGVADVLFRLPPSSLFHEAVWDCAAGALLVEEAGGRITDLTGAPLDFGAGRRLLRNQGYVASNGALHDAALEAIARTG
jgi:3'(2'), 5'-bisphosphate nucleotidase